MARLVPIWMKIAPTSAATKLPQLNDARGLAESAHAAALPTSTGAIAAGSVRGRAAIAHVRRAVRPAAQGRRGNFEKSGGRCSW